MTTITVTDEQGIGNKVLEWTLELSEEQVSVRELIRRRVYEEVTVYNAKQSEHFRGLIQPTDAEQTLNGYRMKSKRALNWERQYDKALEAFNARGFILLVNDRQVTDLDTIIDLQDKVDVTFLKLVPLVGG